MTYFAAVSSAVLGSTLLLTAGCGVPPDGRVGVGRAVDGSLQVYLRTCHHSLDRAVLYWPDDPNGANSNEKRFTTWVIGPQQDPLRVSWPLLGPGTAGIKASPALAAVPAPPEDLSIFAGTEDNSYSAPGPESFTSTNLDVLRPGRVLMLNETGDPNDPSRLTNIVVDLATFDALDCAQYG